MILPNSAGRMSEKAAASNDANMQDVPDADSQLKLNTAAYFAGARTTGGMRRIWLCRPGQGKEIDARLRIAAKAGYPQASTNSTRNAYGIQASQISRVE